eukprot:jgi/Phyca11/535556/estExt2_fgenesh1_pg.C_PHYCAscaffold_380007
MMEGSAMGEFANRLKEEFEDQNSNASDGDECQDWFVNDSPKHEAVVPLEDDSSLKYDGTRDATAPPLARAVARYGTKFFRIYIPQVHNSQTDFCLFARKRLNNLDEGFTTSWTDPYYGGKTFMTPSADTKRFRLLTAKTVGRVTFDIKQEARKQELSVRLNASTNRFSFFRSRSTSVDSKSEVYRSNIQIFINPMADVRCSKTNYTLFKIEKEGDVGMQNCCIAVGIEAHLLE